MAWSIKQRRLAVMAAQRAGWNDLQRYTVMTHVGCPLRAGDGKSLPSVKHPRNTHDQFARYMAIAESCAAALGVADFPSPGRGSWRDAAQEVRHSEVRLIRRIAAEAIERLPEVFLPGFVDGFVRRMTARDEQWVAMVHGPQSLDELDEGQVYRVLEGLKQWVGREMHRAGKQPQTFRWRTQRASA